MLLRSRALSARTSSPPIAQSPLPALPCGAQLDLHESATLGLGGQARMSRAMQMRKPTAITPARRNAHLPQVWWPAAAALCRWLLRANVRGASVLELGAGTGAVGLFAAALGAKDVLLTDGAEEVVELAAVNVERNAPLWRDAGANVRVSRLLWGNACLPEGWSDCAASGSLILGSDVTAMTGDHELLCETLTGLLAAKPGSRAVLAHERRGWLTTSTHPGLEFHLEKLRRARGVEARGEPSQGVAEDGQLVHFGEVAARAGLLVGELAGGKEAAEVPAGAERVGGRVSMLEVRLAPAAAIQ